MWLREAFFRWLIPAAFVLPFWLVVGWIIFGANPLSLLWVLISAPIVLAGQLILTLLVRARGTVRATRAVSWTDVGVLGAWHVLIVALGFFANPWWWALFGLTVLVGCAALWVSLWQLWQEARPGMRVVHTTAGTAYLPTEEPPTARHGDPEIIVISENRTSSS